MGTGDTDEESAIYVSKDFGKTFEQIGGGSQVWRTLSFIFTIDFVFWNTDSDSPQYLSRCSRNSLNDTPVDESDIIRFPIFNSALWNTITYGDTALMSSNVEGAFYDNCRHIFGIIISPKGIPTVYNLWQEEGSKWSSQLFAIGVDSNGTFQFYDTEKHRYRYFILADKNGNKI